MDWQAFDAWQFMGPVRRGGRMVKGALQTAALGPTPGGIVYQFQSIPGSQEAVLEWNSWLA